MDFFKNLFSKKKENIEIDNYLKPSEMTVKDYKTVIPEVTYDKTFDKNKPTILIMDDFVGMAQLIKDELQRVQCCDVPNDFNIALATGNFAAFSVKKMIKTDQRVDVALLDITLGGVVKGVEYDGIDIAIILKKHNPVCVIRFVTGHTLNRHNPEIFQFIKKFEDFFNVPIDEIEKINFNKKDMEVYKHIINKNGNRVEALGATMQEYVKIRDN